MMEYTNFYYVDEYSVDKGVVQASFDSGLFDEIFMANRSIVETKVKGNSKPYLHGFEYDPIEFPLTVYFEDGITDEKINDFIMWISQDYYQPLYFEGRESYVFYCLYHGDTRITHNGIREQGGVITLNMRCKDAYVYSPVYLDDEIDLSNNPTSTIIQFENKGHLELLPEMWITKVGDGDVSIINNSNGGQITQFTDLYDGEIIFVDNLNEDIVSDIPGVYRYSSHNGTFLECVYGVNNLVCEGNFKLQFRYQYRFRTSV